ncbi:D-altronate dehydratase [Rhodovastum atsumiense]|uniref:Altronate dehydratase n=1 Tax=Rhodovastum atsumiense TaxID=504468 RepID=A0A5M6INK9_9PROT|nr:altronate dehydratase family protein [Rhodovastum atsumiense]KAA5609148.1 altronate dehydratase [Rhodovastum atsumiense]CAH2601241.1 D-altronate dehydratase [Rhodovastum atsumiense]
MANWLRIHAGDTVAVALADLEIGAEVAGVRLREAVARGHKVALADHAVGAPVIKYGARIGLARVDIAAGSWVHTHNIGTALGGVEDYTYPGVPTVPAAAAPAVRTFSGFVRSNGDVGVRNDLWIIPLVGCVDGLARKLASGFQASGLLPEGSRALALEHPYGCSQLGDDLDNTRNILRALALHPNAGGVLILGLGCENNTRELFAKDFVHPDPRRLRYLTTQEVDDEVAAATDLLKELATVMRGDRREPVGLDRLRVGLKCGGSDGFSGITANPLLGAFSDALCAAGGSTILTEVPEMFGAERLLMERAGDRDVFNRTVSLINDFKGYFLSNNQPIYENPSPGNKAGGISTLEEKSLGCTQKAGRSIVRDVIRYARRATRPGLTLLEAPGNDGTAVTALIAAGCQMVLFTTGRGTPLGGPAPTMKIATNTPLFRRKANWIDFNAGPIAEGEVTVDGLLPSFVDAVVAVANGKRTRNEENDVHDVVIFKTGVTL